MQYLTGKLGECVQYYPELKEEAQDILWKLCLGIERLTGISADKSCFYISRQAELFLRCIFSGKNSMNTAVVSVKAVFALSVYWQFVLCLLFYFCRKGSVCMRLWKSGKYLETLFILSGNGSRDKSIFKSAV